MAATTTLLGLVTPTQGTLSGTWGDTVNYGITDYVDISVAGTLTLTGDGAVTLANTTGSSSGNSITSTLAGAGTVTAQFSAVRVSGTTTTKVVTGPSYSKTYLVDNASSYAVTFKASGQTGVSISPNEKVYVYYNATDYVKVGGGGITYGAVKTTTYTAVANDGVLTNTTSAAFTVNLPATPSTGTQVFIADSAGTWATNNLTIGRNGSTIAGSATDLVCDINSVSIQCIYDGTTWDIFAQIGANDTAVVTLNGTQTLTNKTLTSPTITGTGAIAAATVTLSSTLSVTGVSTLTGGAVIQGLTVGRGVGAVATNTAVGASALAANTTGTRAVAVGYEALKSNTSGDRNHAFGLGALASNLTGSHNTAVGYSALNGNTADNNTAVGYQALVANTSASNNTAVGYQAGYSNTTAQSNVFIGKAAGYATTTSVGNVFVGASAGTTNVTGANNTFVGEASGGLTTGADNTFVGNAAGYLMTTGSNNTIVGMFQGNQNGLDIRTASNYIVLSDGDGNPRGFFDGSGNFLVGTTSAITGFSLAKINTSTTSLAFAGQVSASNGAVYGATTPTDGYPAYFYNSTTSAAVGYIRLAASSTTYATSSDYRLKENIAPMTGALTKVAQLKPCTYTWKVDGAASQGFIAHELASVVPECVTGQKDAVDANGKPVYQGIDTSFLVATLTAAIQELKAEFDAYKASHP